VNDVWLKNSWEKRKVEQGPYLAPNPQSISRKI
jgi:hypothetical protein